MNADLPRYPMVEFLVRWGGALAIIVALVPPLAGLVLVASGFHWLFLAGGVVLGIVGYLFLKSYAELMAIVSDVLIPK